MRKVKKMLLSISIVLFALIATLLVFLLSFGEANIRKICEEELPKITAYLEKKYNEDMEIYDYSYYDGVIVYVKLKEDENINFRVVNWRDSGKYYDNFLEQYLSNKIEESVKKKLATEKIAVNKVYVSTTTISPLESAEKLYQCYKNVGLTSLYEEAFKFISFDHIAVYVDKKIFDTEKAQIYGMVREMGYPIDKIYVRND